jgi:hypothetical protein
MAATGMGDRYDTTNLVLGIQIGVANLMVRNDLAAAKELAAAGIAMSMQNGGSVGRAGGGKPQALSKPQQIPTAYSVVFETSIPRTGIGSRPGHKVLANDSLNKAMQDSEFAKILSSLGVNPVKGSATPTGFQWHHAPGRPGVMQLVPESQHSPGTKFQEALHPGNKGGYAEWGKNW